MPTATKVDELRSQLFCHPLYNAVQTADNLRVFMREHVFAVWDFMSLLKQLQRIVTCCDVPWRPAANARLARFINEIVLGEECDEDGRGGYSSHFELYLASMDEIGADSQPIRTFLANLNRGVSVEHALDDAPILASTRQFVRSTMQLAMHGQPHEVASAFFYGREDVIPEMFSRLVAVLPEEGVPVGRLDHYLRRHIELDANDHGPLAQKLVMTLCANEHRRIAEADAVAVSSIAQRIALWDGILAAIESEAKSSRRGIA